MVVLILGDKGEKNAYSKSYRSTATDGLGNNIPEVQKLKGRWRLPRTEMADTKNYIHEGTKAKPQRRSDRYSKE